jgi:hypothetical protein
MIPGYRDVTSPAAKVPEVPDGKSIAMSIRLDLATRVKEESLQPIKYEKSIFKNKIII